MKTPCEVYASKLIPIIRAELARELVERGYRKKDVAKMLGITVAAVSQYIHGKRGVGDSEIIKQKVKEIADRFVNENLSEEEKANLLCELCVFLKREIDVKQI